MSNTATFKKLEDYIVSINRRLNKLETGSRPMAGITNVGTFSVTLGAGASLSDIAVTLSWTNPDILANPMGHPLFSIYVDTDNVGSSEWPFGSALNSGQRNLRFQHFLNLAYIQAHPNETRTTMRLVNLDSNSHTYYVYITWNYLTGGSGSE